jgi:hypothetical protein
MNKTINIIVSAFNIFIFAPLILSMCLLFGSIYTIAYICLLAPVFLIMHLVFPSLPIYLGNNTLFSEVLVTILLPIIGYMLRNVLKKHSSNFKSFITTYAIKSVRFEILKK